MLGERVGDLAEIFRMKGMLEGEVKGEFKGEIKGQVNMLERLLQRRFGCPLPAWVRPRLEAADTARLNNCAERISDATSIGDVLQD